MCTLKFPEIDAICNSFASDLDVLESEHGLLAECSSIRALYEAEGSLRGRFQRLLHEQVKNIPDWEEQTTRPPPKEVGRCVSTQASGATIVHVPSEQHTQSYYAVQLQLLVATLARAIDIVAEGVESDRDRYMNRVGSHGDTHAAIMDRSDGTDGAWQGESEIPIPFQKQTGQYLNLAGQLL
jgi:hypothetical protein